MRSPPARTLFFGLFALLLASLALALPANAHDGAIHVAGPPIAASSVEPCLDCADAFVPAPAAPIHGAPLCPVTSAYAGFGDVCRRADGLLEAEGLILAPPHSAVVSEKFRYMEEKADLQLLAGNAACVTSADPHRVVLVYAYTADGQDRVAEFADDLRTAFRIANNFVYTEGMTEGVPLNMRVECAGGQYKVHSVQLPDAGKDLGFSDIVTGIRDALKTGDERVHYVVAMDLSGYAMNAEGNVRDSFHYNLMLNNGSLGTGCCKNLNPPALEDCQCAGISTVPQAAELQQLNGASPCATCKPSVSVVYNGAGGRGANVGNWSEPNWRFAEKQWQLGALLHETLHGMGAMQPNAPNNNGQGHCNDGPDIMCYDETDALYPQIGDEADSKYNTQACTDRIYVDCGHDTYFDPVANSGEFLAINWNIGGPQNKFLDRGTPQTVALKANDDYYVIRSDVLTKNGMAFKIDADSNDYTSDPGPRTVSLQTGPTMGTVQLTNNVFYYTPKLGEIGTDTFTYQVTVGSQTDTATVVLDLEHEPTPVDQTATMLEDAVDFDFTVGTHCGDDGHFEDIDKNWDVYYSGQGRTTDRELPSPGFAGYTTFAGSTDCTAAPARPAGGYAGNPRTSEYDWRPGNDFFGDVTLSLNYKDFHYRKDYAIRGDLDSGCCEYEAITAKIELTVLPVNDAPAPANINVATDEDKLLQFTLQTFDADGEPKQHVAPATSEPMDYPGGKAVAGGRAFGDLRYTFPDETVGGGLLSVSGIPASGGEFSFEVPAMALPAYGTRGTTPTISYSAAQTHFCGTDSFEYTVSDGEFENSATVSITVNCINDPPTFDSPTQLLIDEDAATTTLTGAITNVSPGPYNEQDQTVSFKLVNVTTTHIGLFQTGPTLVAQGSDYGILVHPAEDACGSSTYNIVGTDNGVKPAQTVKQLLITVSCINDPPVIGGTTIELTEGDSMQLNVLATDLGGDQAHDDGNATNGVGHEPETLRIQIPPGTWQTSDGLPLTRNEHDPANPADDTVDVDASSDYCNAYATTDPGVTFNYTVEDNNLGQGFPGKLVSAVITLKVYCVNDPPTLQPGQLELASDEDEGPVQFTDAVTAIAPGPVEEADQSVTLALSLVSTTNDQLFATDPAVQQSIIDSTKAHISYESDPEQCGTATYNLTATDDGNPAATSEASVVMITVQCINDPPSANADDFLVLEDTVTSLDVLANDLGGDENDGSADGIPHGPEVLTITAVHDAATGAEGVTQAGHRIAIVAAAVTITPIADACHTGTNFDTFGYDIEDDGLGTAANKLPARTESIIRIQCVNDAPSFTPGPNVTLIVPEPPGLQTVSNWAKNVTVGPADERAWQAVQFTVTPSDPTLFAATPHVTQTGRLRVEPTSGWYGTTTLDICITDNGGTDFGGLAAGNCHTTEITVKSINDAPTYQPGNAVEVLEDSGLYSAKWATQISAGPPDEAWQSVHFTVQTDAPELFAQQPAIAPDGTLTFRPASNAFGAATMAVVLHDDGGTEKGGVDRSYLFEQYILIAPVNDPPLATPDYYGMQEEGVLEISTLDGFLANDVDLDGDALHAALVGPPVHGKLTFEQDGSFTYEPEENFFGDDHFVYAVVDAYGLKAEALVTITVHNINDAPIGMTDYIVVRPDETQVLTPSNGVLANDIDADGDTLRAEMLQDVSHGTLELRQDGSLVYTPAQGYTGTDFFTYRAIDGNGGSSLGSNVHIRIEGNFLPVAAFDHDTPIMANVPTHFYDESRDSDGIGWSPTDTGIDAHGSLRAWSWSFGDGGTSTEVDPAHTYAQPGRYQVRLTVTDLDGAQGMTEKWITVLSGRGEAPKVAVPALTEVIEGQALPLQAIVTSGEADTVVWRQIAGTEVPIIAANSLAPAATAPARPSGEPVELKFEVIVTDDGVASAPAVQTIRVIANPALGAIELGNDRVITEGQTAHIDAPIRGFNGPVTIAWRQTAGPSIGLGLTTAQTLDFIVPMGLVGQVITIEATATDGERTSHDSVDLRIMPAARSGGIEVRTQADGSLHFLAPPGKPLLWSFGDGSVSNSSNPVHVYPEPGQYRVTYQGLTVTGQPEHRYTDVEIGTAPTLDAVEATSDNLPIAWILVPSIAGVGIVAGVGIWLWRRP